MEPTDKIISAFVNNQVPQFVREDHPNFVAFLKAYYEYLEQSNTVISQGKTIDRAKNLLNYADIDNTLDDFAEILYKEFISFFPKESQADKKTILKHAREFYSSRGNENSFKFFMRLLFDQEATLYFPKVDVLRASTSTWQVDKSVRIQNIFVNGTSTTSYTDLLKFVNTKITGSTSKATAYVEKILIRFEQGVQVFEVFISNNIGTFVANETITSTNIVGDILSATVLAGIVINIEVLSGGSKYNVGDPALITSNTGTGAAAFVSSVSSGNIANVFVVYGGAGFKVGDPLVFSGGGGSGANVIVATIMGTANSYYHANTINLNSDIIQYYANVALNSANFGFPGSTNANANTTLANALTFFSYGPIGPIADGPQGNIGTTTLAGGNNYITIPTADVLGNTLIKNLGCLGRMNVVSGGTGYANGDQLIFTNVPGGYGTGAAGSVRSVDGSGTIKSVQFDTVPGFPPGGFGYDIYYLPTVSVNSANGTNANIVVTALLAYGDPITQFSVNTGTIGTVQTITVTAQGQEYLDGLLRQ